MRSLLYPRWLGQIAVAATIVSQAHGAPAPSGCEVLSGFKDRLVDATHRRRSNLTVQVLFRSRRYTSARADAMAIWIAQFVDHEVRVLDFIEGIGQEIGYYIAELRKRKYDQALLVLPHDGDAHHGPIHKTYKDHFQDAGFEVEVVPNQGPGAAMMRIEALRRLFPCIWFNETTTEAGREALGFYHERKDEQRNVSMGPDHDWSSHAADAAGLMAIYHEEQPAKSSGGINRSSSNRPSGASHWSA